MDAGATRHRPDNVLRALDVEGAIVAGLSVDAEAGLSESPARATMFTDAAIVASHRAEKLGVGPYPVNFLAECVRAVGLRDTHALPEPLIGEKPTELVRGWMVAAGAGGPIDPTRDEMFARWLERVAMLIALRRQVVPRAVTAMADDAPRQESAPSTEQLGVAGLTSEQGHGIGRRGLGKRFDFG